MNGSASTASVAVIPIATNTNRGRSTTRTNNHRYLSMIHAERRDRRGSCLASGGSSHAQSAGVTVSATTREAAIAKMYACASGAKIRPAMPPSDSTGISTIATMIVAYTTELRISRDADRTSVEGADLAAAIIAAVRLHDADRFVPALVGDHADFETRIRRLLAPAPSDGAYPPSALKFVMAAGPALIASAVAGAQFGESVVRTLFSALP